MNLTFNETAKQLNVNRANLYRHKADLDARGYLIKDASTLYISEEGIKYLIEKLRLKQVEIPYETSETAFETAVKQFETVKKSYENEQKQASVTTSNETTMKQVETTNDDLIDYKKLYFNSINEKLADKDKAIAEKDAEITRLNNFIQETLNNNSNLIQEHTKTVDKLNAVIQTNTEQARNLLIARTKI